MSVNQVIADLENHLEQMQPDSIESMRDEMRSSFDAVVDVMVRLQNANVDARLEFDRITTERLQMMRNAEERFLTNSLPILSHYPGPFPTLSTPSVSNDPNFRSSVLVTSHALSYREYHTKMSEPCPICFESYKKVNSIVTECNHELCHGCLYNLIISRGHSKVHCSLCRQELKNVTNFYPLKGKIGKQDKKIRENLLRIAGPR